MPTIMGSPYWWDLALHRHVPDRPVVHLLVSAVRAALASARRARPQPSLQQPRRRDTNDVDLGRGGRNPNRPSAAAPTKSRKACRKARDPKDLARPTCLLTTDWRRSAPGPAQGTTTPPSRGDGRCTPPHTRLPPRRCSRLVRREDAFDVQLDPGPGGLFDHRPDVVVDDDHGHRQLRVAWIAGVGGRRHKLALR